MKLRCIESYSDSYKVGEEYEVIEQLENDRFIIPYLNDIVDTMNVPLNGQLWRFEIAKENKGMKEFKVGQKVKIREWDDMEKEFGLCSNDGSIDCVGGFIKEMTHLCGNVIKISKIEECGYISYDGYAIYPCMCELTEDTKKETKYLNFVEALNHDSGERFEVITGVHNRVLVENIRNIDFQILESRSNEEVGKSINNILTPYGLLKAKFIHIEKQLTLDDFEIGEEFKVKGMIGRFMKVKIFNKIYIASNRSSITPNGIEIYEMHTFEDDELIKIEGENK